VIVAKATPVDNIVKEATRERKSGRHGAGATPVPPWRRLVDSSARTRGNLTGMSMVRSGSLGQAARGSARRS